MRHFLQDAGRNAAYFEENKPGYFMYIGPGSDETWNFEKNTQTNQKESGMNWQNK